MSANGPYLGEKPAENKVFDLFLFSVHLCDKVS